MTPWDRHHLQWRTRYLGAVGDATNVINLPLRTTLTQRPIHMDTERMYQHRREYTCWRQTLMSERRLDPLGSPLLSTASIHPSDPWTWIHQRKGCIDGVTCEYGWRRSVSVEIVVVLVFVISIESPRHSPCMFGTLFLYCVST
jgi:hypothetical protein